MVNDEMKDDEQWAFFMTGFLFVGNQDFEKAIELFERIDTDPDPDLHYYSQLEIGNCKLAQGKYSDAIDYYNKAVMDKNDGIYFSAQLNKAYCLVELDRPIKEIRSCISKVLYDIDVFHILSRKNRKLDKKILLLGHLLDHKFENNQKDVFGDTLRKWNIKYGSDEYKNLRAVYLASLSLISLLHVNHEEEKRVAHYATLETARKLILRDEHGKTSPLQMASAATANDPSEGKILLQSLGIVLDLHPKGEDHVAFMGCFTFNVNSLNQFRLYGKDNKNEATGLSIAVNMFLFSDSPTESKNVENLGGLPEIPYNALYRCMYMDSSSDQIVSVGRRDNYSILLDCKLGSDEYRKRREAYQEYITNTIKDLQDAMDQLKVEIQKISSPKFDALVAELLIGVRYLAKHAAFKEENECRILSVENVNSKEIKFNQERTRMYIEYKPILRNIEQIYFAPNAKHFEVMRAAFKQEKSDIVCIQSTHPFA